ncbi:MAG: hypothetical protein JSS98_00825 [Bacteroidetes bacterium]|nr:hypothetical protein [Bacteroidota bacterium]
MNQIARALGITKEVILNFNPEIYFNSLPQNQKAIHLNAGNINSGEKELYEKILQQKDEEIAYLRNLLKKKLEKI